MTPDPATLPRLGSGRVAEVFALDEHRALKLAHEPGPLEPFEREAAALRAAATAGLPVPRVHAVTEVAGRPGIIMERIGGRSLLDEIGRRPWRLPALAAEFARLHAALGAATGTGLPAWRDRVLRVVDTSPRVPARVRDVARPLLAVLPAGDALVHADFHPGNVLVTSAGPVLIDFASAYRGDPLASHARTLLILEVAAVPPGANRLEHLIDRVGRRAFAARYARAYVRSAAVDRQALRAWRIAAIVERLDEAIPDERRPLLRAFARELRRA